MLAECPDELPPCCARLLQHAPESFDDLRLSNIAVAIRELPPCCARLLQHAPESFDDLRLANINVAIRALRRGRQAIPALAVKEGENGRLDDAGGALFIDSLAAQAVGISIAEFEATYLWEAYRKRRVKSVFADAAAAMGVQDNIVTRVGFHQAAFSNGLRYWSQNRPNCRFSSRQRMSRTFCAPETPQNMPDCLSLRPMTVLQPASTTPEPMNKPRARYSA